MAKQPQKLKVFLLVWLLVFDHPLRVQGMRTDPGDDAQAVQEDVITKQNEAPSLAELRDESFAHIDEDEDGCSGGDIDSETIEKETGIQDPTKAAPQGFDDKQFKKDGGRVMDLLGGGGNRFEQKMKHMIPDKYLLDATQFALCVRTSASTLKYGPIVRNVTVRCSKVFDILAVDGSTSYGSGWRELHEFLEEDVGDIYPNTNFRRNKMNWFKNVLSREDWFKKQTERDQKFAAAFDQRTSYYSEHSSVKFPFAARISPIEDLEDPPYDPGMGSRFMVCQGALGNERREITAKAMARSCTGWWDKDRATLMVKALGRLVDKAIKKHVVGHVLDRVRAELLYGPKKDAKSKLQRKVWKHMSFNRRGKKTSKGLATIMSIMARQRVMHEGLLCSPEDVMALGVPKSALGASTSLLETGDQLELTDVSAIVGIIGGVCTQIGEVSAMAGGAAASAGAGDVAATMATIGVVGTEVGAITAGSGAAIVGSIETAAAAGFTEASVEGVVAAAGTIGTEIAEAQAAISTSVAAMEATHAASAAATATAAGGGETALVVGTGTAAGTEAAVVGTGTAAGTEAAVLGSEAAVVGAAEGGAVAVGLSALSIVTLVVSLIVLVAVIAYHTHKYFEKKRFKEKLQKWAKFAQNSAFVIVPVHG